MKIGLLGGSFNPPHFGHVAISKYAIEDLLLDKIWWLPTKQNPLKNQLNNAFEERLELCQRITKNESRIVVKDSEKKLESNYFYDLLKNLYKAHPKNDYFLLIGSDNAKNFHLWKNWQEIISLSKLAIFKRKGYDENLKNSEVIKFFATNPEKYSKNKPIFLNNDYYDISSTKLRE